MNKSNKSMTEEYYPFGKPSIKLDDLSLITPELITILSKTTELKYGGEVILSQSVEVSLNYARLQIEKDRERVKANLHHSMKITNGYRVDETPIILD